MVVTLGVSKLSGWLNADAPCRVETRKGGTYGAVRAAGREVGGGGRPRCTRRAGEGSTADSGQGTREERTENILIMVVTLEVSKLSGWLNADAP
eukprot:scaffold40102_cov54-Phaeocystis_antarctica.AAC.5